MSHIPTKSQFSSREGSITLSLPCYTRCALVVLLFVSSIAVSFFAGRSGIPHKGVPSECQPNIGREYSLPILLWKNCAPVRFSGRLIDSY